MNRSTQEVSPMPEDTISPPVTSSLPPLLAALSCLLAAHRPAFRQARPFQRMLALTVAHLFAFARHTVTQALLTLGLTDNDWSAWYRLFSIPRLDYDTLTRCFLRATLVHLPATAAYVTVVDGVQIPRHSRTMPGTAWLKHPETPPFKPGPHRAQRFVHLAALLPVEQGYSRALPLRFAPAFPPKAVPAPMPPCREWEAALAEMRWLRGELDAAGRQEQPLVVVGDGSYDTAPLWADLPSNVTLIARCARNRALFALPTREQRRGRPRKYGERRPPPLAWLHEQRGWQRVCLPVRGREIALRYRVEGPFVVKKAAAQPLFLLVVAGVHEQGRRRRRDPAFWLVSAVEREGEWVLPHPATDILGWAWQRWEIEVTHRELKSGFGVGEMQCWNGTATVLSVQWQVWLYGVRVLAGYRAWGLTRGTLRPAGRWWAGARRWSLGTLWRGYRQELWGTADFRALWTGTGGEWWEKAEWRAGLQNAVHASLRA
jgi:hypothetical protein